MMRKLLSAGLAALLWLGAAGAAVAQGTIVVASCPNTSVIYAAGQTGRVPAIDIYGNACGAVGGGGSSGGGVSNASSAVAPTATNIPVVSYGYLFNGATWDQATGILAGTAGAPGADVLTVQAPITLGSAGFPAASTPISGNAAGTTGAVVGTLAANATKTTYICGFNVQSIGGVATSGPITVAGLVTASQIYQTGVNSTTAGQVASANFNPCIPASAINTAITITTTANGTATAVNVNSWGFQQ